MHDALCATEPASPGCSARRSNWVKSWIDSCLEDIACKGFCSSPPCLLIVVAASQIGLQIRFFCPVSFCQRFSIHRDTDRKIRVRKIKAMISKPSRSQFCSWPATNGGAAIWQNHGGHNPEVGIRRDESTNVGAGHVRNSQTASCAPFRREHNALCKLVEPHGALQWNQGTENTERGAVAARACERPGCRDRNGDSAVLRFVNGPVCVRPARFLGIRHDHQPCWIAEIRRAFLDGCSICRSCGIALRVFQEYFMPAPVSVNEFLDLLKCSQLLKASAIAKIVEQVSASTDADLTIERLAKSLVKSQVLTSYQVQRLMAGNSGGFYLGKYKVLDLLGRGGMGKVYLAEQITMQRVVALKVIARFSKNRSDTVARFAREAKAVAALSHPNIIQAFDFDELDGVPFISMEYVEGIDAGEQVDKFGPIGWAQAADYARQAALGLEAARKAGFVHRDVKPGNLLIDREGNVKLLDLGLAVGKEQRGNDSLTTATDQIGTIDYMAPEQAVDSHNVDIRADIYALGCVLYFLVSGKLACPGKSAAEKLLKHQQTPPTSIRELVPEVPEELAKVIHAMLEKKRSARPQTPTEVAEALKPFAQRLTPPYPTSAIRHLRETLTPLLGRSPELCEIDFVSQLSGVNSPVRDGSSASPRAGDSRGSQSGRSATRSPTSIAAKAGASTATSKIPSTGDSRTTPISKISDLIGAGVAPVAQAMVKRQPSGISTKSSSATSGVSRSLAPTQGKKKSKQPTILIIPAAEAEDEFATLDEDFGELAEFPMARTVKKKLGKKKVREESSHGKLLIGAGVTAAAMLVGLIVWSLSPTETIVQPKLLAAATKAELPPASYDTWRSFSEEFKQDRDLVFYYTFSGEGDGGDIVRSQATSPKYGAMNGKVFGAKWTSGRFPLKKGLKFEGNASGQYVSLSETDSNLCNFTTSFSVGAWFRAGDKKGQFQVLLAKGDDSWRLQRWQSTSQLELAANNIAWDPVANKSDPSKGQLTKILNFSSIDDSKWHFAVGVYDLQSKQKTLQIFFDGRSEGITGLDRMQSSKHPVCIGANGERLKHSDPRIWNGAIDEAFVINRALTNDEIERMYALGRPVE